MRPGTDNPWWLAAVCTAWLWAAPMLAQPAEGFLVLTDRDQPSRRIVWGYDAQGKTWPIDHRAGWGVLPIDASPNKQAWRAWVNVTAHARVPGMHGIYVLDAGLTAEGVLTVGGPKVVRLVAGGEHRVIDEAWWLTPGRELRPRSRPAALAVSADERYAYILDAGTRGLIILDLQRRTAHTALSSQLPISTHPRSKHTLTLDPAGGWLIGESITEGSHTAQRWRVPVAAIHDPRWPEQARLHYLQASTAPRDTRRPAIVLRTAAIHPPGAMPLQPGHASTTPAAPPPLTIDAVPEPADLTVPTRITATPTPTPTPDAMRPRVPLNNTLPTAPGPDTDRVSLKKHDATQPPVAPLNPPLTLQAPSLQPTSAPTDTRVDADEVPPRALADRPTPTHVQAPPSELPEAIVIPITRPTPFHPAMPEPTKTPEASHSNLLSHPMPHAEAESLPEAKRLAQVQMNKASSPIGSPSPAAGLSTFPITTLAGRGEHLSSPPQAGGTQSPIQPGLFESWVRLREQPALRSEWLRRMSTPDAQHDGASDASLGHGKRLEQEANPYLLPAAARWARVGWYRLNDAPEELTTLAAEAARLYTDAAQEHRGRDLK